MAINYKSLILDTTTVDSNNSEVIAKQQAAKKKPDIVYTIEGISGPDMVVTKKSIRKEEQFVMLMSQGQMYIKDMKSGTVAMATPENINLFFDKLEEPLTCIDAEGNKLNWTDTFYRGMKFARVLCRINNIETLREYLNKGMFHQDFQDWKEDDISCNTSAYPFKTMSQLYEMLPERYQKPFLNVISANLIKRWGSYGGTGLDAYDATKLQTLIDNCRGNWEINPIYATYGISGMRRYIEEYFQTAVSRFPSNYQINKLFNGEDSYNHRGAKYKTTFDLTSLIQYLFYNSVEQGYANEIDNYIDMWRDTLSMQNAIFKHGIQDKYPETLASTHQILCYKYDLIKQQIDEELWAKQAEEMSKYERYGEKYIIIAPKTPNDMTDEARQQSNCLSSYVRHVIDGTCMIFFLRRAKDPTKSLVTIEVCKDGRLGQVKAKYNKEPSAEERDYVDRWYRDKFVNKKVNDEEV